MKFREPTPDELKLCHTVALYVTRDMPDWIRDDLIVEIEEQLWLKALQTYDPSLPNAKTLFGWLCFCARRAKAQVLQAKNRECRNYEEYPIYSEERGGDDDYLSDEVAAKIAINPPSDFEHPLMDELQRIWDVLSELERWYWWNLVQDRGNYEHCEFTAWLLQFGITKEDVKRIRNRPYQMSLRIRKGSKIQSSNTKLGLEYSKWCQNKWSEVLPLVLKEEQRLGISLRPPNDWP